MSEGCPQNYKTIYRCMSTKLYQRVVHKTIFQSMSTKLYRRVVHKNIFVKVCPLNYIEGLTNKFGNRRLSNELSNTKNFCFRNSFSYMENACVRELVRTRDIGMACRH